ncbi:MAG: hemolysin III family protein [Alphaproteobacteria bacterium]
MTGHTLGELPAETLAEEIASAATHGIGAALSIACLVALVLFALLEGGALAVTAVSVYGASLILLYLTSTLYHGITHRGTKRVLQVLDHCTVFLLIAGTYTPVALLAPLDGPDWSLLATIWALAAVGIAVRIAGIDRLGWFKMVLYLVMGWLVVAWNGPIVESLDFAGAGLLLAGGIAYTAGLAFYVWDSLPFNHAVWHLFVMAGSAAHFFAVAVYIV